MARRLKVLISAYACEPNKGSEPEVGWQWALQMARFHDVTVLTRSNNRAVIEVELERIRERQPVPRFIYHDRNTFLVDVKRRLGAIKLYYLLWQKSAHEVVGRLHEVEQYDLMHHVTFAGFRYPVALWGHGVPVVWGPIGGIESIPRALLPWLHPLSLLHELARNGNNLLQSTPFHVLPKRARATTLILVSTTEMQWTFGRLGFQTRLMPTIGLNTAGMPYRAREVGQGPLKLLFVGNIITLKGVDLALDALRQSGTDTSLTFVGTGNYLKAAKQKTERLGLQSRVAFLGRLPREQVLNLYPDYDVFFFPSLHDTGGYAVIEAMFNELPVICLDCGGPAIAVKAGCGIRVPLGRRAKVVADLAGAIQWYEQNRSALKVQGQTARESILKHYDWDVKGEQMSACYQEARERSRAAQLLRHGSTSYSGMGGLTNLLHRMFSIRGMLVSVLGLSLIGAMGFLSIGHLKTQARAIVSDTLPGLSYAGQANASLAQAFDRTLMILMTDSPEQRKQLREEIQAFGQKTTACLTGYAEGVNEPEDKLLLNAVLKRRGEYLTAREKTLALVENGQRTEALAFCKGELRPAYQRYKEAGDKLFEYNMKQGQSRGHNILAVCTATQWIVAVIGVLIFAAGFLFGLFK